MPIPGRKMKPDGQTVTRNVPRHDWVEVVNVPFEGGPDLPDTRQDGRPWSDRIVAKWDTWRVMPHCRLWGPAEWDFALDTIEVAALFYEKSAAGLAIELRNREKVLGTTFDSLRGLRVRYVELQPGVDSSVEVTNIADYRAL